MSQDLSIASAQWAARPADERYLTLESLLAAVTARAERCEVQVTPNKHFKVQGEDKAGSELLIDTEMGMLAPTHWSFGQLASMAQVPAKWLRTIGTHTGGPSLASYALNYGIQMLAAKDSVQIMAENGPMATTEAELQAWEQAGRPPIDTLRCITGRDYGRIYDREVVQAVIDVNQDGRWHVPSASYKAQNPQRATTLYASDRDCFIFLVDEAHDVEIRLEGDGVRNLHRGFITWNSEVGSATFGLMTFLYDYCCDNRTIWGAEEVKTFTVRHTAGGPDRFRREAQPMLAKYADASVQDVKRRLEAASRFKLGNTDDEVIAWLRKQAFAKGEATQIIESAKAEEGDARTLWQIVQGVTAKARSIQHQDDRLALEQRGSALLRYAA
jgi:hypothetical protein